MLRNYLLIAARKFAADKSYFIISVVGLSVAISAALLIAAFTVHETSYDGFHTKADRIVQINSKYSGKNENRLIARIPFPAKPKLIDNYPEVELVVRFYRDMQSQPLLQYQENRFRESQVVFTDPEVFSMMDFELLQGSREHPFPTVNSVIITEKAAFRYFGDSDPVGKVLRYENSADLTVVGVVSSPPSNSHIQFDFLIPVEFQRARWKIAANNFYDLEEDWNWHGAWTYVLLREDADVVLFGKKVAGIPMEFYPDDEKGDYTFGVQRLRDIHLNHEVNGNMTPPGSRQQLMIFVGVAILLLTIATINFTNLSTAHFMKRMKETALRKTLGARRAEIVLQFVAESVMVVTVALLVGVALAEVGQPFFAPLFGPTSLSEILSDPFIAAFCLIFCLGLGALSALYPATIISRYSAFQIFRNIVHRQGTSMFSFRSSLVIVQLGMSTLLIFGILVIRDQLRFLKNKDLGYTRDNILVIRNAFGMRDFAAFKNDVEAVAGVSRVYRGYFPGSTISRFAFKIDGIAQPASMYLRFIGDGFLETFQIPLAFGRAPEIEHPDSSNYVLINERGVRELGLSNEEVVGRKITYTGGNDNKTVFNLEIVGVLKDANLESLYNPVQGSFFQFSDWGNIAVRLQDQTDETVAAISSIWKKHEPDSPFDFGFLDASIDEQYRKEERLSEGIVYFTTLAILISCFGLLGLTSFITQQRTREIGIRKVHGASVREIAGMFIFHFLKISAVAFLIAIPAGIYLSNGWLQNFAYHTDVGIGLILKCLAIAICLALLTVISKVVHVSAQNPVSSLKYE